MHLCFIETTVFTKRVMQLGLEDELQDLQSELLANPTAGDTDAGTGGLRKLRIAAAPMPFADVFGETGANK